MGATPGLNKARRAELAKARAISCGRCPYHRVENARPQARKRTDRHKSRRKGRC